MTNEYQKNLRKQELYLERDQIIVNYFKDEENKDRLVANKKQLSDFWKYLIKKEDETPKTIREKYHELSLDLIRLIESNPVLRDYLYKTIQENK